MREVSVNPKDRGADAKLRMKRARTSTGTG